MEKERQREEGERVRLERARDRQTDRQIDRDRQADKQAGR